MDGTRLQIGELVVGDDPNSWRDAGFTVDDDRVCRVGSVRFRFDETAQEAGLTGWTLWGVQKQIDEVDGVPTTRDVASPSSPAEHTNGVTAIDHVVLLSPDVNRTITALAVLGQEPRRERVGELGGSAVRQVFYRFGDVIVELVGSPEATGDGPATLWGVTYVVDDIDATAAYFGDKVGRVKEAVQPGRRITTLRNREVGIAVRTAFISAQGSRS